MIQAIKINQTKGITSPIQLENLGKINVLCGKNNSGKSAIINEIAAQKNITTGKKLEGNILQRINQFITSKMGVSNLHRSGQALNYLSRIINPIVAETPYIYSGEHKQFVSRIRGQFSKLKLHQIYNTDFSIDYEQLLKDPIDNELIPPKRVLNVVEAPRIALNQSLNGIGVVKTLHHYKNQLPTSDLRKTYDSILQTFEHITGGFVFDVTITSPDELHLQFSKTENIWHPAEDCGLGFQDILILVFFAYVSKKKLILIEEPENHIHPEVQKRLLHFFKNILDKQFIISTHSNAFLNSAYVESVFLTEYNQGINTKTVTNLANAFNELGYSVTENLVSDIIILTEGPSDIPVIEELLVKLGGFEEYNLKYWPLGGDIMNKLDLSVFCESKKIIALIDNDPGSSTVRKKFIAKCDEYNIPVTRLNRMAIENYFG